VLQPLYVGCRDYLMATGAFLREPMRWLRAISTYRGTTSGGPNFAYELCALRAARLKTEQDLDLSSWQLAFVGAEPVREATMSSFVKAFARSGFRESSLYPCYGLAEATLFVSGGELGGGPRLLTQQPSPGVPKPRALVSCGGAAEGEHLAIVDPSTLRRVAPGEEGEIWASGPNIAQGYWQRPEESEQTFRAMITDEGDRKYLRTGDLGLLVGEELLVTSRLKDLIIVRGQNFYPQDIEQVVEAAHPAVRAGSTAAFSFTQNGEECVAVVTEVARTKLDDTPEAVCQRIRATVIEESDLRLDVVVLIAPQTIFKTSSGKIERLATRRSFLAGELDVVGFSTVIALSSPIKPAAKSSPGVEPSLPLPAGS
jgi:acyl-CoA synthetase (AMP-forming)/AMP-acid ligase II